MKTSYLLSAVTLGLLGLAACSSAPPAEAPKTDAAAPAEKKPAGPAEAVDAKTAFYAMYTPARKWATDIQALSLNSGELEGVKSHDGKFGMWTVVFASPSMKTARTYTYAVQEQLPAISKGVRSAGDVPWAGATRAAMTFENSDFKTNSDDAYKVAAEKAADFLKEHPGKPVTFALGAASRFPNPVWYIMWGDKTLGYAAFVNATTGTMIAK
jgi:hypothetical protein